MAERFIVMAAAALLAACRVRPPKARRDGRPRQHRARSCPASISTGFDRTVRPQDDLYRFVGGSWLARTEIPPDRSNYGSFIILDDQAQEEVKDLIVAASQQAEPRAGIRCAEGRRLLPRLHGYRARRKSWARSRSRRNWRESMPSPHRATWRATSATRSASVSPTRSSGIRRPTTRTRAVYIGSLFQSGLTMPDRDYYLNPDDKYAQFRAKFAVYVEQMLARAGERNAKSAASRIASLETRIANYQWTKVQNRDPVKTYNPMSLPEYQKLAPTFDWLAFFDGMGAPVQKLDISQPSYHRRCRPAGEDRAGGRLAPVFQVPAARRLCAGAVGAVRRPRVRFPPAHAERREGTEAALAPRRGFHGQQHGRTRRPHVRRGAFPPEAKRRMLELVGNLLQVPSTPRSTGSSG